MSRTPRRLELATLAEAAEYLGLSVRTVRRWVADGRITGYRIGPRHIRVDLNEINNGVIATIPTRRTGGGGS